MDTLYIETSIVSYATAWPSKNVQIAAIQEQARNWWRIERPKFELVISQLTLDEAGSGDPIAAKERLNLLDGVPIMPISQEAELLADRILAGHMMPQKAAADALHVALAALARVDYLLTLNCKHIANAYELPRVYRLLASEGLSGLLICTPAEFLGELIP